MCIRYASKRQGFALICQVRSGSSAFIGHGDRSWITAYATFSSTKALGNRSCPHVASGVISISQGGMLCGSAGGGRGKTFPKTGMNGKIHRHEGEGCPFQGDSLVA